MMHYDALSVLFSLLLQAQAPFSCGSFFLSYSLTEIVRTALRGPAESGSSS